MRISLNLQRFMPLNNRTQNPPQYTLNPIKQDTFERQNISFKAGEPGSNVAVRNFQIKKIPNLRCPVCGLIMLSDKQIDNFVQDVSMRRGMELKRALEVYEDDSVFTGIDRNPPTGIYRAQKQQVVNAIKKLALEHPEMSLIELVQDEAQKRMGELIKSQMKIVEELETYLQFSTLSENEKNAAKNTINNFKKQITGESSEQFSRKRFIHAVADKIENETAKEDITNILSQLPTSTNDVNSFFIKYGKIPNGTPGQKNLKSTDIARKLVQQCNPTAEHLVPKDPKNGAGSNNRKNFICDCGDCNSKRGVKPFDDWQHDVPHFKDFLQAHLEEIQEAINEGIIDSSYSQYIIDIIETIKNLSRGEIMLDIPKNANYNERKKINQKRQEEIDKIQQMIRDYSAQERQKRREIKHLERYPQYRYIVQYLAYKNELKAAKREVSRCKSTAGATAVSAAEAKVTALQKKIEGLSKYIDIPEDLDSRISKLGSIIQNMDTILNNIAKLEGQISNKDALERQRQELLSRNEVLDENMQIALECGFDPKDKKDYERFIHLQDLAQAAVQMKSRISKGSKRGPQEHEIISISQAQISEELDELQQSDGVIYHANAAEITQNNMQIKQLEKQIASLEAKAALIEEANKQLRQIEGDKSYEEIKREYKETLKKRETFSQIQDIAKLKEELESLQHVIGYDKELLEQLSDYQNLSNEEFTMLINLAY